MPGRSVKFVLRASVAGVVAGLVAGTATPAAAQPALPPLGQVERVAGIADYGFSGDGHDATQARLGNRLRLGFAADGTLLIADADSRRLRRVDDHGVIDTVPAPRTVSDGGPWFGHGFSPDAMATTPDGTGYFADGESVARFGKDGSWTVIAGGGSATFDGGGYGGDGGPGTAAQLYDVSAIGVARDGSVYVGDTYGQRVRRVDRGGTITTIAGGGTITPSATPHPARSVRMNPADIEPDPAGGVWVVDRKRLTSGNATLLHVDAKGMATKVALDPAPRGLFPVAVGRDGTVYVGSGGFVHTLAADGKLTLAGGPFAGDVRDLAVGPDGVVYAASDGAVDRLLPPDEREGKRQRAAQPGADPWADEDAGTVHRIAGDGKYQGDRNADATPALPPQPADLVPGPDGSVYVLDSHRARVVRVARDGTVDEVADLSTGVGPALAGLASGPDGALYTVDNSDHRIVRVDPGGDSAGDAAAVVGPAVPDDPRPTSLVVDKAGRFYLPAASGTRLQRYTADGDAAPFAGGGGRAGTRAEGRPAAEATLYGAAPAALGPDGSVALVEQDLHAVRVVRPNGTVATVAGNAGALFWRSGFAGDGRPARTALLDGPRGVAYAPDGTLYVADTLNNRVRRVGRDGVITTIAGTGERAESGDDGPANRAALRDPARLAVADDGAIWVTGDASTRVRRIDPDGTISTPTDFARPDRADQLQLHGAALAVDPQGTVYVDEAGQSFRAVSPGKPPATVDLPGLGRAVVAAAPDGSLYVGGSTLLHRYPDGKQTPVVGVVRGGAPKDGADARTADLVLQDVAVAPDGTPLAATKAAVYEVTGGRVHELWQLPGADDEHTINGLGAGPDGTTYVALSANKVVAITDGKARTFAGTGRGPASGDDIGDGGAATDAAVQRPDDVAVTSDGSVFVSTLDGIRRIDSDGDIDTVVPASVREDRSVTDHMPPEALAVDAHDNLYFTEPLLNQVRVVVRPAELPDQSGTSLWWWLGGGALVLAAAAVFLWRRRAGTSPEAEPAAGPALDETMELDVFDDDDDIPPTPERD